MQKKRLSWKMMLLMFMAMISAGNLFAPAPALAQFNDCGTEGFFGMCCRYRDQPDELFSFGSVPSKGVAGASTNVHTEWVCIGLGAGGGFVMYSCGAFDPQGERNYSGDERLLWGRPGTPAENHAIHYQLWDPNSSTTPVGYFNMPGLGWVPTQQSEFNILFGYSRFTQDTTARIIRNHPPVPAGVYEGIAAFNIKYPANVGENFRGSDNCQHFSREYPARYSRIQITVTDNCEVEADNIDFGRFPAITRPRYAKGDIRVTCTMLLPYSVAVTSQNDLVMKSGNGATIPYELFTDPNHTNKWNMGVPREYDSDLNGGTQTIPIYARLSPAAGDKLQPGEYEDHLVVTVNY